MPLGTDEAFPRCPDAPPGADRSYCTHGPICCKALAGRFSFDEESKRVLRTVIEHYCETFAKRPYSLVHDGRPLEAVKEDAERAEALFQVFGGEAGGI